MHFGKRSQPKSAQKLLRGRIFQPSPFPCKLRDKLHFAKSLDHTPLVSRKIAVNFRLTQRLLMRNARPEDFQRILIQISGFHFRHGLC